MTFDLKTLEFLEIQERILKYAYTQTAKKHITLLSPITDITKIKKLLAETDELLRLNYAYGKVPFVQDFDIFYLIEKSDKTGFLNLEEILLVKLYLKLEKEVKEYYQRIKDKKSYTQIEELFNLENNDTLIKKLDHYIDDKNLIKDQATVELFGIRKSIKKQNEKINDVLSKLLTKYSSYLNESVIVLRNSRYCIGIKETYKNKVNGIIHDVSQTGQTIYIEPEDIRQATQDLEHLNNLEQQEINRVLMIITSDILAEKENLYKNLKQLTYLDFVHAKACYAIEIEASIPKINSNGNIHIINGRHPLIDKDKIVPLNLKLTKERPIMLITGPNTGGKTVVLKTVGLLTLMMQSGILVPLDSESELSIYHKIFSDIGDEQSIEQSLSTFSSHLVKLKKMIDTLDDNQLILIDEIGSGTDPNEGVSLAMALLNEIRKHKVTLLVTTHYSEIKQYGFEHKEIIPASMAFDHETLKPLYKLQMGISGSSNALLIAKSLGLKESVIKEATELSKRYESDLTKVIDRLNHEKKMLEEEKLSLEQSKKELLNAKLSYENELKKQQVEFENELKKVKEKEEIKWHELKAQASSLIEELKQKEKLSQPELAKAKHQINKEITTPKLENKEEIKVNDIVLIKSYQQRGIVKKITNNKYLVEFGSFTLSFPKNDLELEKNQSKTKTKIEKKVKLQGQTPNKNASIELDLRGYRYEEVGDAIDKAMDKAFLANMPFIRIIHGFGTGAVRNAVYEYLKKSPYVDSYRFGKEGEGLNGVTVVSLK
ncbi:DNA mismatch repair protein MutS [Alteracholeplasma palmae J233]|uniref:Endonuclease MutS2 n=1 Tax=Alteracholeplasma palmae (strain ATCC 49389 / J233) TaxID=1318466 RepID=U4KRW6_ALTPJ|nr:endonuclease MutS2 [Alteracholeplasma palmae]CCV64506.1 DNA mismatch repair protein MutS [Alteracholeplasma palmae J233]